MSRVCCRGAQEIGGLLCYVTNVEIDHLVFENNTAFTGMTGAFEAHESVVSLRGCTISNNSGTLAGGVKFYSCEVTDSQLLGAGKRCVPGGWRRDCRGRKYHLTLCFLDIK